MSAASSGPEQKCAAEIASRLPAAFLGLSRPLAESAHAKPAKSVVTAKLQVLLVEDCDTDAELFTLMLERTGPGSFAITHVETWTEAAARLRQHRFDVVLLDLSLPDTAGADTFLRAREAAPNLPIVALTGNEDEGLALEAMRQGIEDFVIKGSVDGRFLSRTIRYAIERRRIEDALGQYRELLHAVIEGTSEAVYAKDLNGRYVLANAAAARLAGRTREQLLGADDVSLFGAQSAAFTEADQQVLALGRPVTCEESVTMPLHGRRTFLSTKGPLRARDGTVNGVFGISHDVTEMKRAEKRLKGMASLLELFALRSSRKEYLNSVVKLLKEWCECKCVGVRLLDEDGLLPYAAHVGFSREFLRDELKFSVGSAGCACFRLLTGHPRADDVLCSSPGGSFFCNQTSHCVSQIAANPGETGTVGCVKAGYESLAHAPLRYGNELLGTLHFADLQPGKFPPETVAFIEATAPLVAEAIHKFRIEESLVESESRFRSMFERHASVMLLIDPETGSIVDANPAGAVFYGYSQDQLRRMKLSDLQHLPGGLPRPSEPEMKQRSVSVFMHRLANGEHRIVEAHSSPVRVQQRRLLFSIIHDITERVFLQKAVLDIGERERQRVGQDLHDSLGGKLTGAALMGKALAQKLEALSLPQSELANEVVECINDSIRHTRSIARGLYPVDLSGSGLSGALADLAADAQRHSGIRCEFHADKAFSVKDHFVALHLFRLAMEAVNNALRHAEPTTISISLKTTPLEVRLEIRDDGKGLPASASHENGLGLRTMKYRAEVIGAELSIGPSDSGGTLVCCRLPAAGLRDAEQTESGK